MTQRNCSATTRTLCRQCRRNPRCGGWGRPGVAITPAPNPYEVPGCQETHPPQERIFGFFPPCSTWYCQALARPPWRTLPIYAGASAGVQSTAREQGSTPLACFACSDAGGDQFFPGRSSGGAHPRPVRPQAHPLGSPLLCARGPWPRPCRAATGRRQRVPTCGPRWSRPCPGRGCSPHA